MSSYQNQAYIAQIQAQKTLTQQLIDQLTLLNTNLGAVGGNGSGSGTGTAAETYIYQRSRIQNNTIPAQGEYVVLDKTNEKGRLMSVVFTGTNNSMGLFVELYGSTPDTPLFTVDTTFQDLLKIGSGISPGDVKLLPGNISPDPSGKHVPDYPWLMRYKDTAEADATSDASKVYTMAFTPQQYIPYISRIRVAVKNMSTTSSVLRNIDIKRLVFQNPPQPSTTSQTAALAGEVIQYPPGQY